MSSRQTKYQKHGYLIEEICQTYPALSKELEMRMLEFRMQYPTKYRDWYHYELVPVLQNLQQKHRMWSHSTTPESFMRSHHNSFSRGEHSYETYKKRRSEKQQEDLYSNRSQSRIIQGESPADVEQDSCYRKFNLPHPISKVLTSKSILFAQDKQIGAGLYPISIPQSQYVTMLDDLKELAPFEDKKCFYEYLQSYIDQSNVLSERFLYQVVLLHLKLKYTTEVTDISELLLNEYRKIQGERFLKYKSRESSRRVSRDNQSVSHDSSHKNGVMSRDQFISQPQDSFTTDNVALSREQFISQDQTMSRDEFISQDIVRDQFSSQNNNGPAISREQYMSMDTQINSLSLQSQEEDIVLHRLRKLLLNGSRHKALQWAIEKRDWVSALFIASSMDEASYVSVCTMYINSIPKNDPLRTCLQVQFGLALDYQYSEDWGVHLAAILNTDPNPNVILNFSNILRSVRDTCAQHVCYLSARLVPDGSTSSTSPFTLLGYENKNLTEQIPLRNVILTMAYDNSLPHLQYYKYNVAFNYIKMGEYELSLQILKNIAEVFLNCQQIEPNELDLINYVCDLSLRLHCWVKTQHITWISSLVDLKNSILAQKTYQPIESVPFEYKAPVSQPVSQYRNPVPSFSQQANPVAPITQLPATDVTTPMVSSQNNNVPFQAVAPTLIETESQIAPPAPTVSTQVPTSIADTSNLQPVTDLSSPVLPSYDQIQPMPFYTPSYSNENNGDTGVSPYSVQQEQEDQVTEMKSVGSISFQSKFSFTEDKTDSFSSQAQSSKSNISENRQETNDSKASTEKSKSSSKSGGSKWLSFLSFAKPKNQMILPEDDKPSIIWDDKKKMWVDASGDGDNGPSSLPPPPKMSGISESQRPVQSQSPKGPSSLPPLPSGLSNPTTFSSQPGVTKPQSNGNARRGRAKYVNVLANNS